MKEDKTKEDAAAMLDAASRFLDSYRKDRSYQPKSCFSSIDLSIEALERVYLTSWAASKIIDIPVEDMLMHPRQVSGFSDDGQSKQYYDLIKQLQVYSKVERLVKASRLYGSAFLVMICDDDLLENPITPRAKIRNLLNFKVSDCTVVGYDTNISSPNFLRPIKYKFMINRSTGITVHHSRVIRVDHIGNLSVNSWAVNTQYGSQGFGLSELTRCIESINNEQDVSRAIKHLVKESSIPIMKGQGLQEALAGEADAFMSENMTLDKFVSNINDLKSVYSTVLLGENMDMQRLAVNFSNLPDIMDRYNQQLAAVADIPMTRFFAQSSKGLNNGGEADLANYYTKITAMQQSVLTPIYNKIDPIIKTTLGFDFDFSYLPLWVQSATEKATADYSNAQRDQIYIANGVLTPDEIKSNLYDSDTYKSIEKEIDPSATQDLEILNRTANGNT